MKIRSLLAGAATAALVLAPTAAFGQDGTVQVSAVHGVTDAALGGNSEVDVYVFAQGGEPGDSPTIEFAFGETAGPLEIPAGDYTIEVYPDGADTSGDPALTLDASLPAGANATVVAHLNEAGDGAVLTPFVNDISSLDAGKARVTVRHTAAAPAVDVLAGGSPVFEDLANPDDASADLPADTYSASVAAAGTTDPVIGPADLSISDGQNLIVYAVGSLSDDSLTVLTETIDGLGTAPSRVNTGNTPIDGEAGFPYLPVLLVGMLLLGGVGAVVRTQRVVS